jgi:predicted CXXCH cytochrome family protein
MHRDHARAVLLGTGALVFASIVLLPRAEATGESDPRGPLAGNVRFTHDPYDANDETSCATCHTTTSEGARGPVTDNTNALCLTCHDDPAGSAGEGARRHNPDHGRCVDCHNAHNARVDSLLQAPPTTLCTRCHDTVASAMKSATPHGALASPTACVFCHAPHASKDRALLKDDANKLCLTCHQNDALVDHRGKKLANIHAIVTTAKNVHAPIENEGCVGCHQPHGGEHFRMLKDAFPSSFYAPYARESYALCFTCHEESLVEAKITRSETQFRDGDKNLHAVHVDRGDRGRTCRACHDVHGSNLPHQLSETVTYGSHGWRLPLNFKETEHGGSCAKTCHMVKSYDRMRISEQKQAP